VLEFQKAINDLQNCIDAPITSLNYCGNAFKISISMFLRQIPLIRLHTNLRTLERKSLRRSSIQYISTGGHGGSTTAALLQSNSRRDL
jgi:hypothetical protein